MASGNDCDNVTCRRIIPLHPIMLPAEKRWTATHIIRDCTTEDTPTASIVLFEALVDTIAKGKEDTNEVGTREGNTIMSNLVLNEADDEQLVASLVDSSDIRPVSDHEKDAEAALDSFLETTVAEVNLALSHDDAVTAAVNAAALDATADVSVVVDQVAVTAAAAAADAVSQMGRTTESVELLTPEEQQANLVKNLNMNTLAAGSGSTNGAPWPSPPAANRTGERVGRWTLDEKILFLYGLQKFGKGQWKKISAYVPGR
jgi:Myb-like DNA-binding domain